MTNTQMNILDEKYFGINLYRIRNEKGLTIEELAGKIGKTPRLISYYESREKFPTLNTLIKIVTVLEVTLDSILRSA